MNRKSKLIYMVCLVIISGSCKKDTIDTNDRYESPPATAIPSALKGGLWFWGNFGPVSYYDEDGHEVGNETEAAREYTFDEVDGKGRVEFIQYLGLRNASDCVTEIYTTKKGTIAFEGTDKFIFYPVEGNFKTIKKGCSNDGASTRTATTEDLQPETYLCEIKMHNDEQLLYLYEAGDILKQDPVFVYQQAQ